MFFAAYRALLVNTVSVEGIDAVSERRVLKRMGFPSPGGEIFIFPGAARKAVEKDPWVKSVSVKRDYRGGISIRVREKKPFCLLAEEGELFYIDSSGAVLGRAPVSAYGMNFPVLRSSARFITDGMRAFELSAYSRNAPGWDSISEVVSDGDGVEVFTRDGVRIELGADLTAQWKKLEKITRSLHAMGMKAKYINLRRDGVGIVGFKESWK